MLVALKPIGSDLLDLPVRSQSSQLIQGRAQGFSHAFQVGERTHASQHMGGIRALLAPRGSASRVACTPPEADPATASPPVAPPGACETPRARNNQSRHPRVPIPSCISNQYVRAPHWPLADP